MAKEVKTKLVHNTQSGPRVLGDGTTLYQGAAPASVDEALLDNSIVESWIRAGELVVADPVMAEPAKKMPAKKTGKLIAVEDLQSALNAAEVNLNAAAAAVDDAVDADEVTLQKLADSEAAAKVSYDEAAAALAAATA